MQMTSSRPRGTCSLDYDGKDLSAIEPVDDDQQLRNDITVRRKDGSSARAIETSGPLSVAAPPAGVGRYDVEVELNLENDLTLADRAGWLLHLGTGDETATRRAASTWPGATSSARTPLRRSPFRISTWATAWL
jgi:hypothetical protein